MKFKKLKIVVFFLSLIFALFLMLKNINIPYVGPNATDLNVFSLIARNYNNWGYLNIKFAPIVSLSKEVPKNPEVYLHHPIFMTVFESLVFRIFGNDFWVGRFSVLIPAFLGLIMFFLLGKSLKNEKFGLLSLVISVLVPATIVFGRILHYPGAWTLFFILTTAYFAFQFIKNDRKIFLFLAVISVILGTLSDWPMTYFTPFLLPLFIKNKKTRAGVLLLLTSTFTAMFFLTYSYFILGSLKNILDAILNRSLGGLLTLSFWPLRWISVLLIRFVLYFNPLFVILGIIYIFDFIKKALQKKLDNFDLLIFAFLGVGTTQIILYPEGSFGHPFWIYLLVPFVVFATAKAINQRIKKVNIWMIILLILSIIFVLRIEDWKTQQDLSNVFRYNLAKTVSSYFIPYDTIDINPSSYVNADLYQYAFYQNTRSVQSPVKSLRDLKNANYYVYSCIECSLNNFEVNFLAQNFKFKTYDFPPGRVYIFFLKQKQDEKISPPIVNKSINIQVGVVPQKESVLRKTYEFLVDLLKAPQL